MVSFICPRMCGSIFELISLCLNRRNLWRGAIIRGSLFFEGLAWQGMIPRVRAMENSEQPVGKAAQASACGEVSGLLQAWSRGDQEALKKLTPIVYEELHRLARHYMRGEKSGHSLQTTALVNEAYIRLTDYKRMRWENRAHFFAISAQLMRRILVDHARRHNLKRGGGVHHVSLDEAVVISSDRTGTLSCSTTR